ncbi:MAG: TlpA family protein disulfide reductase [Clostridia bacterium]|nr:TlpA family protein disulfide reductase [Clostridia bacterium]
MKKVAKKNKNKDINNKKKSKIYFILIITSVTLIALLSLSFYLYTKLTFNSKYVDSSDRSSFILYDVDESLLKDYYENRKMLVICWASWCENCLSEIDQLNRFIINNSDKEVIIVSHDNNKDELITFLRQNNLKWFVIYDKDKTIRKSLDPESSSIPHSFLIDQNKKIINSYKGTMNYEQLNKFYNGESIK